MTIHATAQNITRADVPPASARTTQRWAGRVLTAIPVLFLLFDGAAKLLVARPVVESLAQLGYPAGLTRRLGVLLLACLALYVWPRTAVLGAILLTGYLGGAVATHVRVGTAVASHVLFPAYVGLLLWGGLVQRDARLRVLLPVQRDARDGRRA